MFKLSKTFIEGYKNKQPEWGPLGYVVYKRSYARDLPTGGTEEWWQTCQRVVEGVFELQRRWIEYLNTRWDTSRAQKSAQEMFKLMWDFKFLPPGRGLFSMGSPLVMEDGNGAPLFNCSFVSTEDINYDFAEPFCFCFSASAHGIGVGFDTAGANKCNIVEPRKFDENIFIIDDSREGWVEALRIVLNAYVGLGSIPKFDYSRIRPFGAKIKRFGGTASGPAALQSLLEEDLPSILTPGRITSTQIVDIMNVIGKCVVAGGARRSAELALGDANDIEFITLKTDLEKLKQYRWASNNSLVVPPAYNDFEKFVEPIMLNGEPGFFFIDNARNYGRMNGMLDTKDKKVKGLNPCGEITLESYELCNIAEVFISRCETYEDFQRALKYGYLYTKTVTLTKTPWPRTNEIMLRNRRIGLSLTGIIENINRLGFAKHVAWCEKGYEYIQELDKIYSDWLCIPRSIKTTTVKPSGSVSLLPGVTPGVHYPHSEYYIRNVRITKGSPLLAILEAAGYFIEDDVYEKSSRVVSFPVREKFYSRGKDEVTIWEQLENAAQMQEHWSDNSVSITITVKPEEANQVAEALDRYQSRLKTASFLPLMDHSYEQAPYIKITKEQYEEMASKLKSLDLSMAQHEITEKYCDGDTCQL